MTESDFIEVGETYMLTTGIYAVVDIYKEDGVDKIRSVFRQFDSRDLITPIGEPVFKSLPIKLFMQQRAEYPQFKASHELDLRVRAQRVQG